MSSVLADGDTDPRDRAGAAAPPRRPDRIRRSESRWAVALLAPMALGLGVFYLWPILQTFYFSFTEWGVFGGHTWTGLDNYRTILGSAEVRQTLLNTAVYSVIVLLSIPIALVVAALLNHRGLRGVGIYRTLYFLPVVTMPVAVGWLWKFILNGEFGALNGALEFIGVDGPSWLSDKDTALLAMSLVGLWSVLGYPIVLFVAALQGVPSEVLEASSIDGAGPLRRFWSITLPLVSPTVFFVTVLTVIGALQAFDLVYVMIGKDNPAIPQTQTIIYLFYKTGFIDNDKGLASALVFCLMVIIMLLTVLQFRLQRRWVHYA